MPEKKPDQTPIIEGSTCPIRCANNKPAEPDLRGATECLSFPMWLCTEIGRGTIGDAKFDLTAPVGGGMVIQFDDDYDDGRFFISAQDFVETAFEIYKERLKAKADE